MSKKMMKRSLALGALMAFVITGSAMAAELTINSNKDNSYIMNGVSYDYTGLIDELRESEWYGYTVSSAKETINNSVNYSNNTIKLTNINNDNFVNLEIYASGVSKDKSADSSNNNVTVENSVVRNVFGAFIIGSGDATQNTVNVVGGKINNKINGGLTYQGNASNNYVTVDNVTVINNIQGGHAYSADNKVGGDANSNIVLVKGTNTRVGNEIMGGNSHIGNANKNEVTVQGVTGYNSSIYGGVARSNKSNANENLVKVVNTTVLGDAKGHIIGGYIPYSYNTSEATSLNVNKNVVTIKDSIVEKKIYGGKIVDTRNGTVNNNVVNIENSTISNEVFGGFAPSNGEANDNTINIYNGSVVENAYLYGSNKDSSTGNTLNIFDGWFGKIKSVQNFNIVNFSEDSSVTTNVTLGTGATINLADGDAYTGENYAINGKLTTLESDKAILTIGNIKATTYNIAKDYEGTKVWTLENELMDVERWTTEGKLQVTTKAKPGDELAKKLGVSENTGNFVEDIITDGNDEATDFLNNLMQNANGANDVVKDTLAAVQKMGEAGGNSATAANIVKNVTGVTNDRLSFNCGHSAPQKGGHGVGLLEEGSGADIWVEYVHGKDKVEDMPSTAGASSYEGQYNGFVMGVDFKKVGKFQSGIAFNYGEGDTNSVGSLTRTHSDYDFWGVGYYGNIHNDDSNVIFDINYAQTDSDVTQSSAIAGTLEASPETTTWSAGVKLEKLYQNENVQIVPYTGLRYMSIDSDDYATKGKGFMYSMERQDIWLLPLGVSIRQEVANDNGWTVSPRVDLSYIWAFGDTNSNMEVKSGNGITPIGYDVMDDGSFLGLVGIEAHKGQWGYGVAYSYQKGDHSESKKWYVDVNYSF